MHGRVVDVESGEPLPDATVEIWQASTNGKSARFKVPFQH